jgi:hypothetical protein
VRGCPELRPGGCVHCGAVGVRADRAAGPAADGTGRPYGDPHLERLTHLGTHVSRLRVLAVGLTTVAVAVRGPGAARSRGKRADLVELTTLASARASSMSPAARPSSSLPPALPASLPAVADRRPCVHRARRCRWARRSCPTGRPRQRQSGDFAPVACRDEEGCS